MMEVDKLSKASDLSDNSLNELFGSLQHRAFRGELQAMRGELLPVWSETWRDIWSKLVKHPGAPEDLFSELYREFAQAFSTPPSAEALADVVGESALARSPSAT